MTDTETPVSPKGFVAVVVDGSPSVIPFNGAKLSHLIGAAEMLRAAAEQGMRPDESGDGIVNDQMTFDPETTAVVLITFTDEGECQLNPGIGKIPTRHELWTLAWVAEELARANIREGLRATEGPAQAEPEPQRKSPIVVAR